MDLLLYILGLVSKGLVSLFLLIIAFLGFGAKRYIEKLSELSAENYYKNRNNKKGE